MKKSKLISKYGSICIGVIILLKPEVTPNINSRILEDLKDIRKTVGVLAPGLITTRTRQTAQSGQTGIAKLRTINCAADKAF